MKLVIGYLYPDLMNIYGDTGNVLTLKKRCEWRKIDVEIKNFSLGDELKKGAADIYFFGGGQDKAQGIVSKDLGSSIKGKIIKQEVERGVPLLSICGGYQLLGEYYQPHKGGKLPGVGIFPSYTEASSERMIGNIIIRSSALNHQLPDKRSDGRRLTADNLLVGFENHSGKTYLNIGATPLGKVVKGFGNNGDDLTEGCVYKNAIGCYMHGSLLPNNPALADWIIKKALETKYSQDIDLAPLNDEMELKAHNAAIQKFS